MSLKISNLPKGSLDIVKALREAESVLATEAADEIERLRAELAAARAALRKIADLNTEDVRTTPNLRGVMMMMQLDAKKALKGDGDE